MGELHRIGNAGEDAVDGGHGLLDDGGVVARPLLVGPGGVPVAGEESLAGRGPPRGPVVVEHHDAEIGVFPAASLTGDLQVGRHLIVF